MLTRSIAIVGSALCPSNSMRSPDPDGYGTTDYMPNAYTDIDPLTGAGRIGIPDRIHAATV